MAQAPPDAHLRVLITAAVAAALGTRKVRIQRIQLIERLSTSWRDSGRVNIHTSHLIGKSAT